jgi:hypothetical protein
MIDQASFDADAYVRAMLPALGFELPPERIEAVTQAFMLMVRFASPALERDVPAETEPAPVYRP